MKFGLLSSVCGVALLATMSPAFAGNDFSGVAQAYVGAGTTDGSGLFNGASTLDDPFIYGLKGRGIWPLSPDVHLQVDVFGEKNDSVLKSGFGPQDSATSIGGAVHLLHPFENRARLGVVGSVWNSDVFVVEDTDLIGRTDATYGLGAVEGQFFGTDWTVMGQAGVFSAFKCTGFEDIGCAGSIDSGTYLRGKIRYFLSDNTALSLETVQMWGNLNDDGNVFAGKSMTSNSANWILEAEHRFDGSPYAGLLTVSHEHDEVDIVFPASTDTNTVTVGLKFYLDQPSVRSTDRDGAEMDTPQFGNAIQTTAPLSLGLFSNCINNLNCLNNNQLPQ